MGLMRRIVIVDHSPKWSAEFANESSRVRDSLADMHVAVHHIGSTSVPGLAAKPVIDMLLVAPNLAQLDAREEAMIELGYRAKGEHGIPGRRYYSKGPDEARTHHVHAFAEGHVEIDRHLRFRDFLRRHDDRANEYATLKRQLAESFADDVVSYNDGKSVMIERFLEEAALTSRDT